MTTPHISVKRSGRVRLALLALIVAALAVSACSAGGANGTKEGAASLKVLVPAHGDVLDPTRVSAQGVAGLLLGLEPLVRYSSDGELTPTLASSIDQPDPTTYVITIRDDVTFWDGTDLTADDVQFSLDLHAAPDSESLIHPFYAQVADVSATGDLEVTLRLAQPDSSFMYSLAMTPIVSKAFYDEHGEDVGTPGTLNMGTGPYRFVSFKPSSETVLEANQEYWGGEPPYEELTLQTVGDDSARLTAVQSGEFDAIYNIPIAQLDAFTGIDGLTTAEAPDLLVYKFNFDTTKPPFDDVHLRRAFMLAVDRADIVEGALGGRATLAPAVVPSDVMETAADAGLVEETYARLEEDLGYDLTAARDELAKSAHPDGVTVEVLTLASDPNLSLIAQTAAQTLAEIGIELDIKQVDDNTYYEAVYFTHQTDGVSLDGFSGPNPAPITMPYYTLHSAFSIPAGGQGSNLADYNNPEVDGLLEQAAALPPDDARSGELILEAMEAAQEEAPYVPIAFPQVYVGVRDGLQTGDFDTFWWMTDWPAEISSR